MSFGYRQETILEQQEPKPEHDTPPDEKLHVWTINLSLDSEEPETTPWSADDPDPRIRDLMKALNEPRVRR
jgi:hypothetical protein